MKYSLVPMIFLVLTVNAFGQDPQNLITRVLQAQKALQTVSYSIDRTDTLLTDDVRSMSGSVLIVVDRQDPFYGFKFWAKKNFEESARIYDGHNGYILDFSARTFELSNSPSEIRNLLDGGGGHLILKDLIKLDTSKAISYQIKEDQELYYLTLNYADFTPEQVVNRYKTVKISKKNMLPVAVRQHQEVLGKVQDLQYQITTVNVNEERFDSGFLAPDFLKEYSQKIVPVKKNTLKNLQHKQAPAFELVSFKGDTISSANFLGKVILLDFWEVWCSPCLVSMPKVEALYEKYKDCGLLVYGISHETKQLATAKLMSEKKSFKLPMLVGNEQTKKNYSVSSLPLYVLIDRKGSISFLTQGFSDEIEAAINKALL